MANLQLLQISRALDQITFEPVAAPHQQGIQIWDRPELDAAIAAIISSRGEGLSIARPTYTPDTALFGIEAGNRGAISLPELDAAPGLDSAIISSRSEGLSIARPTYAINTALLGIEAGNRGAISLPELDAAIRSSCGEGLSIARPTYAINTALLGIEAGNRGAISLPELDAAIISCRGEGLSIARPTYTPDTVLFGIEAGNRVPSRFQSLTLLHQPAFSPVARVCPSLVQLTLLTLPVLRRVIGVPSRFQSLTRHQILLWRGFVHPSSNLHSKHALLGIEAGNRGAISLPELDAAIISSRSEGLSIARPTYAINTALLGIEAGNRGAISLPELDAAIRSSCGEGLSIARPTYTPDTGLLGIEAGNRGAISLPELDAPSYPPVARVCPSLVQLTLLTLPCSVLKRVIRVPSRFQSLTRHHLLPWRGFVHPSSNLHSDIALLGIQAGNQGAISLPELDACHHFLP